MTCVLPHLGLLLLGNSLELGRTRVGSNFMVVVASISWALPRTSEIINTGLCPLPHHLEYHWALPRALPMESQSPIYVRPGLMLKLLLGLLS